MTKETNVYRQVTDAPITTILKGYEGEHDNLTPYSLMTPEEIKKQMFSNEIKRFKVKKEELSVKIAETFDFRKVDKVENLGMKEFLHTYKNDINWGLMFSVKQKNNKEDIKAQFNFIMNGCR